MKSPGFHCIKNNCQFAGYSYAPNEIAYSGESGEVPDSDSWIGFGGEMELDNIDENKRNELKRLWKDICKDKIQEAYEEYMNRIGQR